MADHKIKKSILNRLSRYYLACLNNDDKGFSVPLNKSKFQHYAELKSLEFDFNSLGELEQVRNLVGEIRKENSRYGLYFGYPINIKKTKHKYFEHEELELEPVIVYPIEETNERKLRIDVEAGSINSKTFKNYSNFEPDMVLNEIVELEKEIGFDNEENELNFASLAQKLEQLRPEWPWINKVNPKKLNCRNKIEKVSKVGIHNRAIIMIAEKSKFTFGLEQELNLLSELDERNYEGTVLAEWLESGRQFKVSEKFKSDQILEILPMNSEQRSAVSKALNESLTVVTGPPGTGKSQVVTNLIANAVWKGKRVLVVSKNNQAVDVVEKRVNSASFRPILFRAGGTAHFSNLEQYAENLLSSGNDKEKIREYESQKSGYVNLVTEYEDLQNKAKELVTLRNQLDSLEQNLEESRKLLGAKLFKECQNLNITKIRLVIGNLKSLWTAAQKKNANWFIKFFWCFFEKDRLLRFKNGLKNFESFFNDIDKPIPDFSFEDVDFKKVDNFFIELDEKLHSIELASTYYHKLKKLQSLESLEVIAKREADIISLIAKCSKNLWNLWLETLSRDIKKQDREYLTDYRTFVKMIMDLGGNPRDLNSTAYYQYRKVEREISKLIPAWAITTLSVKSKIAFEPACFDLVIFDEASQCDIASALPILYRAKSIVVIGDPKQLSHITNLRRGLDLSMLERHGLTKSHLSWAYSYNSLFDLAALKVEEDNKVNLVDHHRSHADIINFSNKEFYEGMLRVATRYNNLKNSNLFKAGISWIDAKGSVIRPSAGGAYNDEEVISVVDCLRRLSVEDTFKGSIGVVTPFRAQANKIRDLIVKDRMLSEKLAQNNFLVDTVHKFQGDERDIILFSPVLSLGISDGAIKFLSANGNLFNVAITRARGELIVVGDMTECLNCKVGYLSRFAKYVMSLDKADKVFAGDLLTYGANYPQVSDSDLVSDWEKYFYEEAYKQGIFLLPQYSIEKYVVDFVLLRGDRRLAIEIDGELYHRNWTGELRRKDQIRNQRLIELGFDVTRFWVYEVRDDLEGCFKRLKEWLEKYD